MKRNIFIITILALLPWAVFGQAERSDIRRGNKLYQQGKYPEAEVFYKKAEQKSATSYEAAFNMAGALYKQQRYEQAGAIYAKLAQDGSNPTAQANVFYNNGNTLMAGRQADQAKLDQAIESYKNALRINPSDMQAKFNLAYAQKLKQEQQDKDKDKNQDKNKDNQDQNQNKDQQNQDQNKDKNKDNKDQQKEQPQEPKPEQKQDSERMLNAVQASEDNTKKKVEEQKAAAAGKSDGKNW